MENENGIIHFMFNFESMCIIHIRPFLQNQVSSIYVAFYRIWQLLERGSRPNPDDIIHYVVKGEQESTEDSGSDKSVDRHSHD